MNLKHSYHAVIVAFVAWQSLAVEAQAIRYELIDGAAGPQAGHTLKGFIEFDFPCGNTCTASNVTDFSFAVSGPSNFSYSYQSPADVGLTNGLGQVHVIAESQSLTIDFARVGSLTLGNPLGGTPRLEWLTTVVNESYSATGLVPTAGWVSSPLFPPPQVVIANVIPEPSTTMTLLAALIPSILFASRFRFCAYCI